MGLLWQRNPIAQFLFHKFNLKSLQTCWNCVKRYKCIVFSKICHFKALEVVWCTSQPIQTWHQVSLNSKLHTCTYTTYIQKQSPEEDWSDHIQSLDWQPSLLCGLIWWFASLEKVWYCITLNALSETRCHKTTQTKPSTLRGDKGECVNPHRPFRKIRWTSAPTSLTAYLKWGPISDLVITNIEKNRMVIHDTKCPYRDQFSFNAKLTCYNQHFRLLRKCIKNKKYGCQI